jgi:SAM-dependent methyltransferase
MAPDGRVFKQCRAMRNQDSVPSAAHEHNRRAWDARAKAERRFARPIADAEFAEELKNLDADGWLVGAIRGRLLLCLGSGGGRQSVLYAAAGANVTVVDISAEMLDLDRQAAAARGLAVRTVQASIDHLAALPAASFDTVIQPVSTCYVPDVTAVYREVARVTAGGGLYVSQHKQPASLQAAVQPATRGGYELTESYYRTDPLPSVTGSSHREEGTLEFLHRWEDLIGGLCRAGFVVEDLIEPLHAKPDAERGSFARRSAFLPPYVRIKARRVGARCEEKRAIVVA